ncbi:MAG: FKBP-type peptidyl-prolyl cis-trans isomerase [Candidatus Dojkabacteria bacterium]
MNQRTLIATFLILSLFASVLVLGGTTVVNQRFIDNSAFQSQLKGQSTDNLEKLTTKLEKVESITNTQPTDSNSAAVKTGDNITVNYKGWLAETGVVFDQSFNSSNSGFTFTVGSGVIEGWSEGVVGMKVGEIRRLKIPSSLGYGEAGSLPTIPSNADLIFDIELIRINN